MDDFVLSCFGSELHEVIVGDGPENFVGDRWSIAAEEEVVVDDTVSSNGGSDGDRDSTLLLENLAMEEMSFFDDFKVAVMEEEPPSLGLAAAAAAGAVADAAGFEEDEQQLVDYRNDDDDEVSVTFATSQYSPRIRPTSEPPPTSEPKPAPPPNKWGSKKPSSRGSSSEGNGSNSEEEGEMTLLDVERMAYDDPMLPTGEGRTAGSSVEFRVVRPRMSYAQLIAEAMLNAENRRLTLNEIYIHISAKHPYYSLTGGKNWQNAVRHNLTLNKNFVKVPRPSNEGRGSYWTLEQGAEKDIFKRLLRHHYMQKSSSSSSLSGCKVSKGFKSVPGKASPSPSASSSLLTAAGRPCSVIPWSGAGSFRHSSIVTEKDALSASESRVHIVRGEGISRKVAAAISSSSPSLAKPTIIYLTFPKKLPSK